MISWLLLTTSSQFIVSLMLEFIESLYSMRVLRNHGLPATSLTDVFRATIIAKLTYCSSTWSVTSAHDRARIDAFLRRRQESSAKLTNQLVSYAFTSSPLSFHAHHILPTSKFQHSYFTFFLYQWTACVKTVSVNTFHWFDASSLGNTSE